MQGMTIEQLNEVTTFIEKYHKFGKYITKQERLKINGDDFNLMIKYIDFCYDTRSSSFWSISFRGLCTPVCFATNHFNALNLPPDYFNYNSLFDWVMDYLKGVWTNRNILKDCILETN